jgi:hypothetical protein
LCYTKAALLIFGLGLVVGFIVVVGEFSDWNYLASGLIALGLLAVPLGLFADGRGFVGLRWIALRFFRRKPGAKRGRPARAGVRPRRPPSRTASRSPRRVRS